MHELGVPARFAIAPTAGDGTGSFAVAVGVGESGEDEQTPFALAVERTADGELSAQLVAFRSGTVWRWADRFALSDLVVDLLATR